MVVSNKFLTAIEQFNDVDFFSAHDLFEELWTDCRTHEKELFRGFVQLSVGMFHLVSGNLKGAVSQLRKSVKNLRNLLQNFPRLTFFMLFQRRKLLFLK
jgi:predicted metal-dependent hydrolase